MLDFQLYKPYIQHRNEHINKRYNNNSYVQRGNDFTNCFDKSLRKNCLAASQAMFCDTVSEQMPMND